MDASNGLSAIPLKTEDNRHNERSYERDFELVVDNNLRGRADDHFNSQQENFANLYISAPSTGNDEVIYGAVPSGKQRTSSGFNVDDHSRYSGDGSSRILPSQPLSNNRLLNKVCSPLLSLLAMRVGCDICPLNCRLNFSHSCCCAEHDIKYRPIYKQDVQLSRTNARRFMLFIEVL